MKITLAVLVAMLAALPVAAQDRSSAHARKTLEIYTHILAIESAKNLGNVPKVANYLAAQLRDAGFPAKDVEVLAIADAR